ALAAPVLLATATPAFASGESTTALLTSPVSGTATTFTWSYVFNQGDGHGLSNIAIGFCSADILADVVSAGPSGGVFTSGDVPGGHTGFGPGVKFGVTATTGTLTVTFGHSHAISAGSLRVESHSGDGQTGDEITTAAGPSCQSDEVVTPPGGNQPTGGTAGPNGTPNTDSEPTLIITSDPAPTSTTEDPAPAANPPAGDTTVLGATLEKPALPATASPADDPAVAPAVQSTLANTGSDHTQGLLRFGLGFLGAGVLALAAGRRRRTTSVSSAG
ncbi:MAG TPA: hypothetical protein VGO87_05405, partial [Acidimicrobiia bacterium]